VIPNWFSPSKVLLETNVFLQVYQAKLDKVNSLMKHKDHQHEVIKLTVQACSVFVVGACVAMGF
jgi:rRNA-processing protein FCF1